MKTRARAFVLVGVLALLALPGLVLGAQGWSVVADRSSVPKNSSTSVKLTITNQDSNQIGCVGIFVGSHYDVSSASIVSVSNGGSWSSSVAGGSTQWVIAQTSRSRDELDQGDKLVLRINVTGTVSGRSDWVAWASRGNSNCQDGDYSSSRIQMTVGGTAPTPNPKPKPTPRPTPRPTPLATAAPTAAPGAVSTPKPTPNPTPPPKSSQPSLTPSQAPLAIGGGGTSTPPGSTGIDLPGKLANRWTIPVEESNPSLPHLAMDVLASLGVFAWAMPAATLTVPGLLLILVIGAQMMGAMAWLPVIRSKIGGFGLQRSRRASQ